MPDVAQVKASSFGSVVMVQDPFHVVINRGAAHGIKMGERFLIYSLGQEVQDPETGESLGRVEVVRGIGKVVHIQEKMAMLESDLFQPAARTVRRTVRSGKGYMADLLGGVETVEETGGTPTPRPLVEVSRGDHVRPI